ncbi:MAG: hypothetical protein COT91_02755, partial [Candidatus Doudnabacteria bacterium CG10_big_fil_rev_8_21_14_0_10_41_10]
VALDRYATPPKTKKLGKAKLLYHKKRPRGIRGYLYCHSDWTPSGVEEVTEKSLVGTTMPG